MKKHWATLIVCGIVLAVAPLLSPYSPTQTNPALSFLPPSAQHWLGTDHLGRDVFSRLLYGGQKTVLISLMGWGIALVLGVIIGCMSGLGGRWLGSVADMILRVFLSLPNLMVALLFMAFLGRGLGSISIAVGISYFALLGIIVRGQVRWLLRQEYIEASRALGATRYDIAWQHLRRHMLSVLLAYGGIIYSYILVGAVGLSFLGLGDDLATPEWGVMLAEARYSFRYAPHIAIVTGVCLSGLVFMVNRMSRAMGARLPRLTFL